MFRVKSRTSPVVWAFVAISGLIPAAFLVASAPSPNSCWPYFRSGQFIGIAASGNTPACSEELLSGQPGGIQTTELAFVGTCQDDANRTYYLYQLTK